MSDHSPAAKPNQLPPLAELGADLLDVTPRQRWTGAALTFL
jgi:hypothetical protein